MKPYKQDSWTSNYIFARLGDTVIISVYLNPRKTQEQLESLMWYIR